MDAAALLDDLYQTDAPTWTKGKIRQHIITTAQALDLDPALGLALAHQESHFNPAAKSPTGVEGLFQVTNATGKQYGQTPETRTDPVVSTKAGLSYLKYLLGETGGDRYKALMRYNGGSDPQFAAHVLRWYPLHAATLAPPASASRTTRSPSLLQQAGELLTGSPAEAAAPSNEAATMLDRLYGAREQGQPASQPLAPTPASPPVAQALPPVKSALVPLDPGMTDDEVIQAFGYDPAVIKQATFYRPGDFSGRITDPTSLLAKVMNSPLGGAIRGVRDIGEGGLQLATRGAEKLGLYGPSDVAYHDLLIKLAEADYQQNIRAGSKVDPTTGEGNPLYDPARLVGNAAVMLPGSGVISGTTMLPTIARGVVGGAMAGATQPVMDTSPTPGAPGDPFATQKTGQVIGGGLVGGVAGPVMEKAVVPLVTKGVNALRGVIPPAAQELIDLGNTYKVRLSYGDVSRQPLARKIETTLEELPGLGMSQFREGQQKEIARAASGKASALQEALTKTPYRDLGAVRAAAAQGRQDAQALLAEVASAGDDWATVVQASGKLDLFLKRLKAERLYDEVETLAEPLGNFAVPKTTTAITQALKQVDEAILPSAEVRSQVGGTLQRVKTALTPRERTRTIPPGPGQPLHAPPTVEVETLPVDTTYGRLRALRSELGDLIRDASDPQTARALLPVKQALEEDMATVIRTKGDPALQRLWREADTFYRTAIVPYRTGRLATAIAQNLPDEIYPKFVKQGADRARYFYQGLDPRGQAAVRYGMVAEALETATQPATGLVSPAKFAGAMERLQDASQIFFKGAPQFEIEGFVKLLRHAERAGQYLENPPTGKRLAPLILGGSAATAIGGLASGNPGLAIPLVAEYGMAGAAKLLLTTTAGRRYLLAARTVEPGSPAMQRLVTTILKASPTLAAQAHARAQGDVPAKAAVGP